jgi:hypothetical protein
MEERLFREKLREEPEKRVNKQLIITNKACWNKIFLEKFFTEVWVGSVSRVGWSQPELAATHTE